jgi:hypothetical protein
MKRGGLTLNIVVAITMVFAARAFAQTAPTEEGPALWSYLAGLPSPRRKARRRSPSRSQR